jgi:hypothetical protein
MSRVENATARINGKNDQKKVTEKVTKSNEKVTKSNEKVTKSNGKSNEK